MRKLLLLPAGLLVLAFGAASVAPAPAASTVRLKDDYFTPKSLTVSRNTTVTFRWAGRSAHNLLVSSGPVKFNVSPRTTGTYRKKFTRRGTYRLLCSLHSGMTMKLRVR